MIEIPQLAPSRSEEIFDRLRRLLGMVGAPVAMAVVWIYPFASLSPDAHHLAAVMAAVVVLWISEALPMPITALLGAAGCVVLGVAPAKQVFAPFADPIMFLFIGSFMLARAIFLVGLDRRLAFWVLAQPWVGGRPVRVLGVYGAAAAGLSAWISNTATTAMMLAIGLSLLRVMLRPEHTEHLEHTAAGTRESQPALDPRYATALMLITSFAASIGGLATPIGTPTNLIGLGFIREQLQAEVSFFEWMQIGVPVVVVLYLFLFGYLAWLCPAGLREIPGGQAMLVRQRAALGPWTTAEWSTLAVFTLAVGLWIAPGVAALTTGESSPTYRWLRDCLPEGVVALVCAGLLFIAPSGRGRPVLEWSEAVAIDWGVVLLYGGGFALGTLSQATGLAEALGTSLAQWVVGASSFQILLGATAVAALLSELTSNTASAVIVVPLVIATARQAGCDPLEPALGATFGASMGFMMPVSTPCNAIVYSSGYIPLSRMVRYGALLDVAGVLTIVSAVHFLAAWLR